ncbi:MAG: FAD-binding protein, partial [Chloroflexi bacterium]|nr:FAD-binding protein [Chloroflexota bacterium]
MATLTRLFSPIKIGNMEIKNRIVMSPMTTLYADLRERITPQLHEYYVTRAKGGVGMITLEVCTVDRPHNYQFKSLALWDDKFIPSHKELTSALHVHGVKVVPQISHPGPESRAPLLFKIPAVGPSVVTSVMTEETCKELTLEEIAEIVRKYGDAARRAREAGYDGMELHGAHSYMLVGSFLSPLRNKRTDQYGGSLENRLRFPIEVIKSMKAATGGDFPLIMRISGDEIVPGGRTLEDTVKMVPILAEAGVDAFHVSGGVIDKLVTVIQPGPEYPLGLNVPAAAAIKKAVKVPIMVVGRIKYPTQAEEILQKGQADMVVMARALLADPELPNKAKAGKLDDIRHCISCLNCFDSQVALEGLNCAVNAQLGFEGEYKLEPAPKPKKVMIIGGGPAGMEAARVAAIRGHQVTLHEKLHRLGGSLIFASTVHPDNEDFLKYEIAQMNKFPVTVRLNSEVTPAMVSAAKPDVVIVALGPDLVAPKIAG